MMRPHHLFVSGIGIELRGRLVEVDKLGRGALEKEPLCACGAESGFPIRLLAEGALERLPLISIVEPVAPEVAFVPAKDRAAKEDGRVVKMRLHGDANDSSPPNEEASLAALSAP